MTSMKWKTPLVLLVAMWMAASTLAQPVSVQSLLQSLQQGGMVIVMRHTNSPRQPPDAASANADNLNRERQLDAQGRADAQAIGAAIHSLGIPVTEVISSPTYRALETAKLAGFSDVTTDDLLSNEGMQNSTAAYAQHLQELARRQLGTGNRVIITHGPNVEAAFPAEQGLGEGDALIVVPEEQGVRVAGRILIDDWKQLSGD